MYKSLGYLTCLFSLLTLFSACGEEVKPSPIAAPVSQATTVQAIRSSVLPVTPVVSQTPQSVGAGVISKECPAPGSPVPLPASFPKNFPLPPGTIIKSHSERSGGRVVFDGFITTSLKEAVDFFQRELPKAGFKNKDGDAEEDEAEADFEGNGYTGHWKLRGSEACPNIVSLSLLAGR